MRLDAIDCAVLKMLVKENWLNDTPPSLGEIAKQVSRERSPIHRRLEKLERYGFVDRAVDEPGRSRNFRITASGTRVFLELEVLYGANKNTDPVPGENHPTGTADRSSPEGNAS